MIDDVILIELPQPDKRVGKGASVHHWTYRRLYNQHRRDAGFVIRDVLNRAGISPDPTACYRLDIEWHYWGRAADSDNVTTRVAPYRDAAQDAGLVADDAQIMTGYVSYVKVRRGGERVVLRFVPLTKLEDER